MVTVSQVRNAGCLFLLQAICQAVDSPETKIRIATIAFCCFQLRDATSYFSCVNIAQEEITKCKNSCQLLFNPKVVLLKSVTVTPTLWAVGYAVPRHLQMLFHHYGMGLGINNMQGREAKHVRLSQFGKHW